MLEHTKNWIHDKETHLQSVIDDLVTYHNLMEAEKKLTAKEWTKMKVLGYQELYMKAGKPNWTNIDYILVRNLLQNWVQLFTLMYSLQHLAQKRMKQLHTVNKKLSDMNFEYL
jgi:cell fate (sporulation/competence/biofilm development) regulator YlbF (YheA/YmcA/DUF963 family)